MSTLETGQAAEDKACEYLKKHGLKLIEKNYRCRNGEIDLIMQDKNHLVFVEVRYRNNDNFGSAIESIDKYKIKKIVATAQHYLTYNKLDIPARFDVIGFDASLKPNWISNAFNEI